ncbi:methyltransferase type 11 [Agromyces rhizosphaerae]|uniref:Methyltransferase type 11 n=1 Tax=Agromyces rhizosphaerae TaxID=88374 RepID=A0A9W6CUX8_9MICO|nr:class I SAM-dependent methyltransferase [Agromyces rhizosphaerae]GLI27274.1 methyltransferase type 11 [Agromyces rhizosphaerae]
MADYDPRLVELYDEDNPDGPDHDFYRALADSVGARSVLDIGCGTGMLTVTLARPGRSVVGVDPSAHMLEFARARSGASDVAWVLGDSRAAPAGPHDYVVMTGNVAQHIGDAEWVRTLADIRSRMRPGGVLAFESRNPAVRAWEEWASAPTSTRETRHGPLTEWMDVAEHSPGVVELVAHNRFERSGETVVERLVLHFRDRAELERQLDAAGFDVEAVHGDWSGEALAEGSRVMVFVARAR